MRRARRVLGTAFAASLLAAPAAAQVFGTASDAPIELDAREGCDGDLEGRGPLVCRGDVVLAQGPSMLTADTLSLTFYPGTQDPKRVEAEGRVRYASGEDAISGARGVFDGDTSTITVTGDVIVVQGEQVVTGERLVYNTETGAISLSAAPGQRVRGLFVTKPDGRAAGAEQAAAPEPAPERALRD